MKWYASAHAQVCVEPPHFCIVTELCVASLYKALHEMPKPLKPERRIQILRDVAGGMHYLHQASTRILGRRTAPLPPLSYFLPRPAWFYPNILVLTRIARCSRRRAVFR